MGKSGSPHRRRSLKVCLLFAGFKVVASQSATGCKTSFKTSSLSATDAIPSSIPVIPIDDPSVCEDFMTLDACLDLVPKYARPGYAQKIECLKWYPAGCENIQISLSTGQEDDIAWVPKETPNNFPAKEKAAVDPFAVLDKEYHIDDKSADHPYCVIVIPPSNYNFNDTQIVTGGIERHQSSSPIYYRGSSYYPTVLRPTGWQSVSVRQPGYVSRAGFASSGSGGSAFHGSRSTRGGGSSGGGGGKSGGSSGS
jgi:uncharacterized membrane protein YgcG